MPAQDSQHLPTKLAVRRKVLKGIYSARVKTWDFVHGVDTCGSIPLATYDFDSQNKTPGLEYQSHHPRIIRNALIATGIDFRKYTFVDYGCGKGRVLLVASQFPFRRIVGLEFVPQLAEIARRNVDRYRALHRQCRDIQVITGDAAEFDLPPQPALLYFFSPFSTPVMNKVFNKIESSLEQAPRDVVVLFTGMMGMRDRAFGRPPYQRVLRHPYYDVYLRQATRAVA